MSYDEARAAEDGKAHAMIARDVARLSDLLGDDLRWIHSSGKLETKAEFLRRIEQGDDRYLAIAREDEDIRLFGDVVLVSSLTKMDALVGGAAKEITNRSTAIWVRRDGRLQLISSQSTRV